MESNEYWRKRALRLEARANKKGEALQKQLKREYTKAAKAIREKVDSFYMRYAKEQGLTYAEAIKALSSKEAREWRKTLGEYVEEIKALPDGATKSRLIAELDMRSYASQQDRLSTLAGQIDMEIDRLFIGAEQQMTATMSDVLEDGYYRKSFDLQQRAGVMSHIPRLSPEMVEDVLTYPWSGADFSTRLWNNKRALLFNMRQTITQGLIQGQSIARMSKDLGDALGKSYIVTERLIRTETNHFHAEADKSAYEAAGVERYEFMATLDNRTSKVCADLDGDNFPVKDAQPGKNYPPMHPWCRSTTVEYDPEDAADWAASGEPMPKSTTYEEWKKAQDTQNEIEQISIKENSIDALQRKKEQWLKEHSYDIYGDSVAEMEAGFWEEAEDGSMPGEVSFINAINEKIDNLYQKMGYQNIVNNGSKRYNKLIKGAHSIEDDLKATNPNFNPKSFAWSNNCQRCVPAYEMRRRGFDVSAMPRKRGNDETAAKWRDIFKDANWIKCGTNRKESTEANIINIMQGFGDGARAEVYIVWEKYRASHVFVAENVAGNIRFIDPQSNNADVSSYFSRIRSSFTEICRLDNLETTELITECCK